MRPACQAESSAKSRKACVGVTGVIMLRWLAVPFYTALNRFDRAAPGWARRIRFAAGAGLHGLACLGNDVQVRHGFSVAILTLHIDVQVGLRFQPIQEQDS